MAQKYQVGDTAFIVESNRFIREVKITKYIACKILDIHFLNIRVQVCR